MSEQVPVPARVMALNLLDRVDYADAFIAKNVPSRTPEEWARIIVHNASPLVREFVCRAHQILRLRVERSDSPEKLMGWTIRHRGAQQCVLGAEGALVTPESSSQPHLGSSSLQRCSASTASARGPSGRSSARYTEQSRGTSSTTLPTSPPPRNQPKCPHDYERVDSDLACRELLQDLDSRRFSR